MLAIGCYQTRKARPALGANNSCQDLVIQIRLQLQLAECYPLKAILSNLISEHK